MLVTETLFGTVDKVQIAIDRIRQFEPPEGYYVAFSGGKDSQTVYHLCKEAGVKFDAHYNLTTVDPPELVYFIRDNYPDVIWDKPKLSMWSLIVKKLGPPSRIMRYCCKELKEKGGEGRICVTGVRWAESRARLKNRNVMEIVTSNVKEKMLFNDNEKDRRLFENCLLKGKRIVNPIVDWEDEDVWAYLNSRIIAHCSLYDEGFERIGCIGCPLAGTEQMVKEFERWPKYKENYIRAFEKAVKARIEKGKKCSWKNGKEMMDWWIYAIGSPDENQSKLFDEEDDL
jgi:phosphoadenosine phosphosulfate reductase